MLRPGLSPIVVLLLLGVSAARGAPASRSDGVTDFTPSGAGPDATLEAVRAPAAAENDLPRLTQAMLDAHEKSRRCMHDALSALMAHCGPARPVPVRKDVTATVYWIAEHHTEYLDSHDMLLNSLEAYLGGPREPELYKHWRGMSEAAKEQVRKSFRSLWPFPFEGELPPATYVTLSVDPRTFRAGAFYDSPEIDELVSGYLSGLAGHPVRQHVIFRATDTGRKIHQDHVDICVSHGDSPLANLIRKALDKKRLTFRPASARDIDCD